MDVITTTASPVQKHLLKKTELCPQCDKESLLQGNQPTGNMTWMTKQDSLLGYEDCDVIIMNFTFYEGIQGTLKFIA